MLLQFLVSPTVAPGFIVGDLLSIVFKILFIISALFYVVFAFVVVRQIKLMGDTFMTSFSPVLRVIGWIHVVLSILVLFIFFVIL